MDDAVSKPTRTRLVLLAVCLLALAACRREEIQGGAVTLPTATPTPRSTPLPAVPTAIPPGDEGNAIRMVIRPQGPAADARSAVPDLEAAILDRSGVVVEVQLVERYAEALAALCESSGRQVSAAWLNAPTYAAARAQNCGLPALQVQQGTRRDLRTAEAGSIIVRDGGAIRDVRGLNGRSFCRLGYDDFYSWFAPLLVMRANGLDPVSALESVSDYDDIPALVRAVAEGDCDAAGIPESALTVYAGAIGDDADQVRSLLTTVPFPFDVLMLPVEVPLGKRLVLVDALEAIAGDPADAVTLRALLAQNALVPVTDDDFADLLEFINSTGLDFTQLGG